MISLLFVIIMELLAHAVQSEVSLNILPIVIMINIVIIYCCYLLFFIIIIIIGVDTWKSNLWSFFQNRKFYEGISTTTFSKELLFINFFIIIIRFLFIRDPKVADLGKKRELMIIIIIIIILNLHSLEHLMIWKNYVKF